MSEAVIRVEGISKRYRVGERERYRALRDVLASAVKFRSNGKRASQDFIWAVRDVSFEVKQGEVVGLIGRNGAGKSTLLKLLARITRPTLGHAELHGRIGSLLEVGTGFHPELTGRENIFLSGAILGMSKAEIRRKYDEIVAFAEVERFIDTPLKHYSSGMQMRLAFAVAAHLEPEILLVDEVLSVGDLAFQKKCLGKMGDVAKTGRTIIFVSHQMNQIRRLCHRVVWIDMGQIRMDASSHEAISAYESAMARGSHNKAQAVCSSISQTRFTSWQIVKPNGENPHMLNSLDPVTIRIALEVRHPITKAWHGMALYNHEQQLIWAWASQKLPLDVGEYALCHTFPMLPVRPGSYTWLVTLYDESDNELDSWYCEPEMIVATEGYQAPYDQWTGILNLPSNFEVMTETMPQVYRGNEHLKLGSPEHKGAHSRK